MDRSKENHVINSSSVNTSKKIGFLRRTLSLFTLLCWLFASLKLEAEALRRPPNRGEKCDTANSSAGNGCYRHLPTLSTPSILNSSNSNSVTTTTTTTTTTLKPSQKMQITTTYRPLILSASTINSANLETQPLTHSPGLITKTTDAIYRALSSVFTYEDERIDGAALSTTMAYDKEDSNPTTTKAPKSMKTTLASTTTTGNLVTSKSLTLVTATPKSASEETSTINNLPKRLYTTSLRPEVATGTTEESSSTKLAALKLENSIQESKRESEFISFMKSLMKSFTSFKNGSSSTNRSIRLAPEPEIADFGLESGKLVLRPDNQPATSEDLHLLCKLLHRHFDNSSSANNTSGTEATLTLPLKTTTPAPFTISPPISSTTTSATTITTRHPQNNSNNNQLESPLNRLFVGSFEDLGPSNESLLLESVFDYSARKYNRADDATKLISSLYNTANRLRNSSGSYLPPRTTTPSASGESTVSGGGGDYETDEPSVPTDGAREPIKSEPQMIVKTWDQATRGASTPGHLHLIYWLLERQASDDRRFGGKLRVLNASEALGLLDLMDHSYIKQQVELAKLSPVQLVASYKQKNHLNDESNSNHNHQLEPNVIDDTLRSNNKQQPASGLSLLVDRLTGASFTENLHLYLILFLLALLLVILCFAVPLICCGKSANNHSATIVGGTKRRRHRDSMPAQSSQSDLLSPHNRRNQQSQVTFNGLAASDLEKDANSSRFSLERIPNLSDESQKSAGDSIWRKLSTTTTTLVKDQSHSIRTDGSMPVSVVTNEMTLEPRGKPHFEWYSFEDRIEEQEELRRRRNDTGGVDRSNQTKPGYTVVTSDKRSMTKSVQTSVEHPPTDESVGPKQLEFRDRHEARSSDTLTKSELVLLKEKLMPIGFKQQQYSIERDKYKQPTKQVASQTSFEPPDYVNQSALLSSSLSRSKGSQTDLENRNNHELSSLQMADELQMADTSESSAWRPADTSASVGYIDSPGVSLASNKPQQQQQQQQQQKQQTVIEPTQSGSIGMEIYERRPKIRHVELPPKAKAKVEAIKSELSRLERQGGSETTYKRYDI